MKLNDQLGHNLRIFTPVICFGVQHFTPMLWIWQPNRLGNARKSDHTMETRKNNGGRRLWLPA